MVETESFNLETAGKTDILDITNKVYKCLKISHISDGIISISIPESTVSITTIEYESGVIEDLKRAFESILPSNVEYRHNLRWGDGNGYSHLRAALLGSSLSLPVSEKKMLLGHDSRLFW